VRLVPPVKRVRALVSTTWFLGFVLFVITWPVGSLLPGTGLDNSFAAGLHLAAHEGLRYGTQVVATYGPLGFLRFPFLYYTWTARLALVYAGGVHLLLCLSVLWSLRRMLPVLLAFALALVVVAIVAQEPESALVVVIVWCVAFLRGTAPPAVRRLFPVLAGIACGVEVLVKINTGATIAIVGVIAIVAAGGRSWRPALTFAATFLSSSLITWYAAGQGLDNIWPYVSSAREVIGGWSTAMMLSAPAVDTWFALITALVVLRVAWRTTDLDPPSVRAGVVLIWLVLGFSIFKEGFVRAEAGHESIYFATALGAAVAFTGRAARQRRSLLSAALVLAILWFAVTQSAPESLIAPVRNAEALGESFSLMTNAAKRNRFVARARASMISSYGLDPKLYEDLRGHTVSVIPSEQSLAWAYQLDWRPVPVYQLYYAFTPSLDDLNARVLASPSDGPQRLLRTSSLSIDTRYGLFDSPAGLRSMLCHYTAIDTTIRYEVLTRVPNRCGGPQLVKSVKAHWGQLVTVPPPPAANDLLFVRVSGVAPEGLEKLWTLLWHAQPRVIALKSGAATSSPEYRLVPDTAADGLLMLVPSAADYPRPFALSPEPSAIEILRSDNTLAPGLRYDFYAQPISAVR
jgi:hypothetical protein